MSEELRRARIELADDLFMRAKGALQGYAPGQNEIVANDAGLEGEELVRYWDEVGAGEGGFYDDIREHGCSYCDSHTPGCCDGCA